MKKVISRKNLPAKLPVTSTVLYTFLMYHFDADRLWWGVFIALTTLVWIALIAVLIKENDVDVFNEKEAKNTRFADRLREIASESK